MRRRVGTCGHAVLIVIALLGSYTGLSQDAVQLGRGAYYPRPRTAIPGSDVVPPVPSFRSGAAAQGAAPTNQWYSSVMFGRWSAGLHAHPMTYRATPAGFEVGLPTRSIVTENGSRELRYPHTAALIVAPTDFKPQDARLAGYSDWLAHVSMVAGNESLNATILHGSPFSYYEVSSGDLSIHLAARPEPAAEGLRDARVSAFKIAGHAYAVFAPSGARFEWTTPTDLVVHLKTGKRYLSIAGLPEPSAAAVKALLAVAYAFPTATRAEWSYDEARSRVRTQFTVTTVAKEGQNQTTVMGLYPHQWGALTGVHASIYGYDSVRGRIRLIAGNTFTIERAYHGVLPRWAGLEIPSHRDDVDSLLATDVAGADQLFQKQGNGTYWIGKGVGAVAQLLSVAEAQGKTAARDELLDKLKARIESWLDGRHDHYFVHDASTGTFLGYPEEFGSVSRMNDHHFHYGYWIMGAAHVALRDPAWISKERWGGMVQKLVADIATDERHRQDFPFLRNFDAYEGHSWASGDGALDDGNNQESSSEAVNAWAALILLGEATHDDKLRNLGVYLYTTEVASAQQYWFDLSHEVLPAEFGKSLASLVFGGKVAYNTWWTQEPHEIIGINAMPITPAMTYLARDPAYVKALIGTLPAEDRAYDVRGIRPANVPSDIWQDVIASYLALADPDAGLKLWNRHGMVEFGETRSHTLYWILSLKEMGVPDFSVTANTALYGVFKNERGNRTYLAYNAKDAPLRVAFSDGYVLEVAPHELARNAAGRTGAQR